jgi:hypothetical protein
MISQNKIITIRETQSQCKVYFGNPHIEITEGVLTYKELEFLFNNRKQIEYNENELEMIKQYIWDNNIKNNLLDSNQLVCINVPNKISINEFLNNFTIYHSYIHFIRVMKSALANVYFIYLKMKNKEYANIFFNTFNYSKVSPIEKEYYVFTEVKEITLEEVHSSINGKIKLTEELSYQGIGKIYGIKSLVSPSSKISRKSISFENNREQEFKTGNGKYSNNDVTEKMLVETMDKDFYLKPSFNSLNTLNSLDSTVINPISSISHTRKIKDEILVCSICLDAINNIKDLNNNTNSNCYLTELLEVTGSVIVLCGHTFHIECCLKLDDDKCPLCRYSISPMAVSTCSLCSCENDLWMCLICGTIGCGELGGSSNHRREHFLNTGHIYAKGLGDTHNVTFDFTRNCSLNNVIQFLLTRDFTNSNADFSEVVKDPKEKVESIMSEYNSIISSQLENQRRYYLDLLKRTEESFLVENTKLDREIEMITKDIKRCDEDMIKMNADKTRAFEELKQKDQELKKVEQNYKDSEEEYKNLAKEKNKFLNMREQLIFEEKNKIAEVDDEIHDLESQINDLNIHMKTLEKVKKDQISGASIEFLTRNHKKKK